VIQGDVIVWTRRNSRNATGFHGWSVRARVRVWADWRADHRFASSFHSLRSSGVVLARRPRNTFRSSHICKGKLVSWFLPAARFGWICDWIFRQQEGKTPNSETAKEKVKLKGRLGASDSAQQHNRWLVWLDKIPPKPPKQNCCRFFHTVDCFPFLSKAAASIVTIINSAGRIMDGNSGTTPFSSVLTSQKSQHPAPNEQVCPASA